MAKKPAAPAPKGWESDGHLSPSLSLRGGEGEDVLPVMLEFRLVDGTELWRVEKFDLLAAEFDLEIGDGRSEMGKTGKNWPEVMGWFEQFCRDKTRQWLVVRRLFGVAPVIPGPAAQPDDLRTWSRAELKAAGFEVSAELAALRARWQDHNHRESGAAAENPVKSQSDHGAGIELELDDKVLEQFQFSERMFEITVWSPKAGMNARGDWIAGDIPRPARENRAEQGWFIGRVKEWSKMLAEPMAGPVARGALMNDLYQRRLDSEIALAPSKDREKLYDRKQELAASYGEQVEKLQEMFPEMKVAGRVSFRGTVSDLIVAHRDYYANADRRLVDKVSTAAEIEFQLRTSAQQRQPRYRFSLNVAIVEAIHGLHDPDFRTQFKPGVLKMLDEGLRSGIEAVREAQREPVVDLERGVLPGEGDDFEDFNDAVCTKCGKRISSSLEKCPHCQERMKAEGGPAERDPALAGLK
jgi:hypothetical protein